MPDLLKMVRDVKIVAGDISPEEMAMLMASAAAPT
jgi:hypothetical protein